MPDLELPDNREAMSFTVGADGRAGAIDVGDRDGAGLGTLNRVS